MFVNSKGKISADSVKAVAYIMEEKLGDSAYVISKYDLKHQPLSTGTYKDDQMTLPSGKFTIYGRYKPTNRETGKSVDQIVYRQSTGYYLNGAKTGTWIIFDDTGEKDYECTVENGKLNGPYQEFNPDNGKIDMDGNFENGKKEGDWNAYAWNDPKPVYTDVYKHGVIVRSILHTKPAVAPENLDRYLSRTLRQYIDTLKSMDVVVNLLLNESGRVDSLININKPLPDYMVKAIKAAFSNAPVFAPALHGDMPVKQAFVYNFTFSTPYRADSIGSVYSRHADEIGRGLNQAGIGKPVN